MTGHVRRNTQLRIFQNLLIVEATKDTPYMQRALSFTNAADMDEFLRNHAVKSILPDEDEAEAPRSDDGLDEMMVPASTGLFAILLSIASATEQASAQGVEVAGEAIYWTEFIRKVRAYIVSEDFHDRGIKLMMAEAEKNVCAANFSEVVCA